MNLRKSSWGRWPVSNSAMILAGIVLIGTALRIYSLGDRSLWRDEIFAVQASTGDLLGIFFPTLADNGNMLSFWVAAHFWSLIIHPQIAVDEFVLRLLPATMSIATIPIIYFLTRKIGASLGFEPRGIETYALIAAGFFALNALSIRFAQEFRSYSMQLLLLSAASLILARMLEKSSARMNSSMWWVGYALLSSAAVYAHMVGALLVAAQLGALFIYSLARRNRVLIRESVLASALIGFALSPLALTVYSVGPGQFPTMQVNTTYIFSVVGGLAGAPAWEFTLGSGIALALLLAFPKLGLLRLVSLKGVNRSAFAIVVLVPLIAVPIAAFGISFMVKSIILNRYLQFMLLPVTLTSALGAATVLRWGELALARHRRILGVLEVLVLAAAAAIMADRSAAILNRPEVEDWRGVVAELNHRCPAADSQRIVLTSERGAPFIERTEKLYPLFAQETVTDPSAIDVLPDRPLCIVTFKETLAVTPERFAAEIAARFGMVSSSRWKSEGDPITVYSFDPQP